MDAVGSPELSLPEAIFVVLKQLGPFTGFDGVKERVAQYGDISTKAVPA